jgi:pimeloyl-ACP methyl ester carboxylesterase
MRKSDPFAPPAPDARLRVPSADGTQLNIEVHGPSGAPTVVLIHGWTCKIEFWAPVIRALRDGAPDLRVIAYDQRGHGASESPGPDCYSVPILVEDLTAVLDAALADGEQAVLVGHSMGGMTIMAAGGNEQILARTAGVVLCSTGFRDLPASSYVIPGLRRHLPRANKAVHRLLLGSSLPVGGVNPVSRALIKHTTLGPKSDKHLQTVTAKIVTACRTKPRAAWGAVLADLDVFAEAGRLDVPTSVVFGSKDRLSPPDAHANAIAAVLPKFEGMTTLTGVGHMTPMEAPDIIVNLIRKRVQLIAPPAPTPTSTVPDTELTTGADQ